MSSRAVNVYREKAGDLSAYVAIHTGKFQGFDSNEP